MSGIGDGRIFQRQNVSNSANPQITRAPARAIDECGSRSDLELIIHPGADFTVRSVRG